MDHRTKSGRRWRKKHKINQTLMKTIKLFFDRNGQPITNTDILRVLENFRVQESELLYIHSALSFGLPNTELKRHEILNCLLDILLELRIPTICMPTFTFSFCNGNTYDPLNSRSRMGALNEYFRVQPDVKRSADPLMSVALIGKDQKLISEIGTESVGKDSNFDLIRKRKNVKFLFIGTKIGDCFTYMHYLEWLYKVDYRYNRAFKGIVCENGKEIEKEYLLFVRYKGITPNKGSYLYEQEMYNTGLARQEMLGDSSISIVDEPLAADFYKSFLEKDPYYFVDVDPSFKEKDKTFVLEKEMVAL
jgi:aminoglycoside 3-N-acetyltransferase